MNRYVLITAICLIAGNPAMADDFGLTCEKKHGNGKFVAHLVNVGFRAFVITDNMFRAQVNMGQPQSVRKIESSDKTIVYRKDYWGGADVYTISRQGEYIRLEGLLASKGKYEKYDERCRFMTSKELDSILKRAVQEPQKTYSHPLVQ